MHLTISFHAEDCSLFQSNAFPEASTGGTGLSRPFLLQIDTFGKWLRYLTNVCYVKLKKLRYLDKLRLSESGGASGFNPGFLNLCLPTINYKPVDIVQAAVLGGWRSSSKTVTRCVETKELVQPSFAQVTTPVPCIDIISFTMNQNIHWPTW